MDFSQDALDIARSNFRHHNLRADYKRSDLECNFDVIGSYDLIISIGVLEHIRKLQYLYHRMSDILKPKGLMIHFIMPEKPSLQNFFIKLNHNFSRFYQSKFKKNQAPWLDPKTQSKTADVYRNENGIEFYNKILRNTARGVINHYYLNPFPTISKTGTMLDYVLLRSISLARFCRSVCGCNFKGFETNQKAARVYLQVYNNK